MLKNIQNKLLKKQNCNLSSKLPCQTSKLFSLKTHTYDSFKVYTPSDDHTNPKDYPFLISTQRGFLPRTEPILELPKEYAAVENLLTNMPWNLDDGSPGLLQKGQFGDAVISELPEITIPDNLDSMLYLALYRDYSYITSAYLFENCHHNYLRTGKYGLARDFLPANVARPFKALGDKLDQRPFMEYNSCYASGNYYRKDKSLDLTVDNVGIYRQFINVPSEAGFIHVHVVMNNHGPRLIQSGIDILKQAELRNRKEFNIALSMMSRAMLFINQEFERMYSESKPEDYNIFRTFILGITNQPMFPKGCVYEGCYDNQPVYFRGESGANDNIIPFADNILELTQFMPVNPLTEILRDFRSYRPKTHREFLEWSENAAKKIGVLEYAKEDPESMFYLLEVVDQIRAFRHRHWVLTNMYILNFSKHPVATGGSPIATWLPNQLITVIEFIKKHKRYAEDDSSRKSYLEAIVKRCEADERIIYKQVESGKRKVDKM